MKFLFTFFFSAFTLFFAFSQENTKGKRSLQSLSFDTETKVLALNTKENEGEVVAAYRPVVPQITTLKADNRKRIITALEAESNDLSLTTLKANFDFAIFDLEENTPIATQVSITEHNKNKQVFKTDEPQSQLNRIGLFLNRDYLIALKREKYYDTSFVVKGSDLSITELNKLFIRPKFTALEVDISDIETGEKLAFGITLTNKTRNEVLEYTPEQMENGKYKVRLREYEEYELEVKDNKSYSFYASTFVAEPGKAKKVNIELYEFKVGAHIPLFNISFATGKADLNENTIKELNRVIKLLKNHPTARVRVEAHTDDKGSVQYNLKLSEQRAKAVYEYLIKEISPKRLEAKGYGKSKPIASNATEEGRAKNRRFELLVLSL
jgi:outer membrane protein OmpA-like peptidoglycan-associated protein